MWRGLKRGSILKGKNLLPKGRQTNFYEKKKKKKRKEHTQHNWFIQNDQSIKKGSFLSVCIFDCNNHSVLCKIHSVVNFTKNISLSGVIGPLHSISGVKGLTHAWSITKIRLFKSIENFTTKK